MSPTHRRSAAGELLKRVYGEFLEMPGLRLTCEQAQRLWGLDESACLQILESLVEAKFLYRSDRGMYTRLTDGPPAYVRPRVVNARIDDEILRKVKEAV
jgi:predicted transcriptional regulator